MFLIFPLLSVGQVGNDNIENRLELKVNAPFFNSNTTHCTVQRNCVDESLTGKCIEYHNDQWFWFRTDQMGRYYLNISGQQCRETRGVQLVVIDGEPCNPKTYRVLNCTSLATQDDIFVSLDSLQAGHSYLLNVDGYLHDFCQFGIGVSTQPAGIPIQPAPYETSISAEAGKSTINVSWKVEEDLGEQIASYQVLRRFESEPRFSVRQILPNERNTFGKSQAEYSITDTIRKNGRYHYKIMAVLPDSSKVLAGETTVAFGQLPPGQLRPEDYIILNLDYRKGTPITIYVFDDNTRELLKKRDLTFDKTYRTMHLFIDEWRQRGIKQIQVRILNQQSKAFREERYGLE